MKESRLLHIYSQPYEHGDAVIVGSRSGLALLADVIMRAIEDKESITLPGHGCLFATDGEGYQVRVKMLPEESVGKDMHVTPEWAEYPPHYCDRGYDDDKHKET